jgi:hypothetical protein
MSSSIPLAYLPIRSGIRDDACLHSHSSTVPAHQISRTTSQSQSQSRHTTPGTGVDINNDANEASPQSLQLSSELKEGGYGWVVTACKQHHTYQIMMMSMRPQLTLPGSFTLMFLYAGTLYSWGIFQADLARRGVASSFLLSTVGALQAFCQAIGCMPVSLNPIFGFLFLARKRKLILILYYRRRYWSLDLGSRGLLPLEWV